MPELVASCCTLLVLAPLALMPGMGEFLFRPMAMAVAFAMIAAYLLSRSFVPARCAAWLRPHAVAHPIPGHPPSGEDYEHRSEHEHPPMKGWLARGFERWEALVNVGIANYVKMLGFVMQRRVMTVGAAAVALVVVVLALGTQLRREFFPEVDAGAFEIDRPRRHRHRASNRPKSKSRKSKSRFASRSAKICS